MSPKALMQEWKRWYPEGEGRHVILLLHGIRTIGEWQDDFVETVVKHYAAQKRDAPFEIVPLDVGKDEVFSAWKFFIPFFWRPKAVSTFLSDWQEKQKIYGKKASYSIIAHSFGTWVVFQALRRDSSLQFNKVIFAGSLLRRNPGWERVFRFGYGQIPSANRVVNDIAVKDWPVLMARFWVLGMGPSGLLGFRGIGREFVVNRRFPVGHSGLLKEEHFLKYWIPFLEAGGIEEGPRPRGFRWRYGLIASLMRFIQGTLVATFLWLVVPWGSLQALGCPLVPLNMPRLMVKACVLPFSYEEAVVTSPPQKGECGIERLEGQGYSTREVYWHRFRIIARQSSVGALHSVKFIIRVSSAWELIPPGAVRWPPSSHAQHLSDIQGPSALGWEFNKVPSPSAIEVTVCGRRVKGSVFPAQPFSTAIKTWAVTRRE